jgi:5-formyltetrahydrofolate cyclo-ligase
VRARLPPPGSAAAIAASIAAQQNLLASPLLAAARTVGLYRALPSECGTAAVAIALEASGAGVSYPAIVPGDRALQFRRATGVFVAGALGVEEATGSPVSLDEIEVLVVPALAVDLAGRRIGRGRGHYDATLARFRGKSVALVFESQLVPEVPVGEHDQRVTAICTESRFFFV